MKQNRISHTAAYIAIKFYGLTLNEKLGAHFSEEIREFYGDVVRFLPRKLSWYYKVLGRPRWRKVFVFSEELLLPGDLMHIVARKFYIQKFVSEALQNGIEQVLIPGAGFDHIGVFSSEKGIPSFEVDTPYMTQQKKIFLKKYGYDNEQLFCCPLDVSRESLVSVLEKHPEFHPRKKTLIITEGFFDYLNLETTTRLLTDLTRLCQNHTLITTLFSLDELNFFHRFSFTSGVALVGEALKLPLDRDGFLKLLKNSGYKRDHIVSYQEMENQLIRRSGIDLSVLKGFYVIQATHQQKSKI